MVHFRLTLKKLRVRKGKGGKKKTKNLECAHSTRRRSDQWGSRNKLLLIYGLQAEDEVT